MSSRKKSSSPEIMHGYYEGSLLVSSPSILDPRFKKAVIYLVSHNANGAMGLIINKPLEDISFHEIVLGYAEVRNKQKKKAVLFGGPVDFQRGFLLHSSEYKIDGVTLEINQHFHLTNDNKVLKELCAGTGPAMSLFTLGYSGWTAGQLEREVQEDSWLVAKADPSLVFSENFGKKYTQSLASLGIRDAFLVTETGNA